MNGMDRVASLGIGFSEDELVGLNDEAAVFALAHVGLMVQRLFERHPNRRSVAFGYGFRSQHVNIDTLLRDAIGAQGPRDMPAVITGIPRLDPGSHAVFDLADDLVGCVDRCLRPCRCLSWLEGCGMQPTSRAAMSGGSGQGKKAGGLRPRMLGPGLHGPCFLALTEGRRPLDQFLGSEHRTSPCAARTRTFI